ncbi:LysR family transcriptional regulator [Paraburkholderia bannensis]|uniref:LysR family transcriptional regulator n=1 Tax=Paraburkholderia bannensis TaxID=765414 RepID=UPI002AB7254D|nr:LysR family transcriptional regulator [Paraburkholderia bannensis]
MELRQLRYFLAVAEHLHFSEAARALGIAQPPLSQQILKLEKEVGTRLFVRHSRHVELTETGRLFRERALRIVEDADLALAEAQNAGRGETGRLNLGFAGSTVFHPLVATLLQRYRTAYPGVAIGCEESNSSVLLERVSEARVDAAFVRLPLDCRGLETQPLVEEDVLAVLPPRHRLARRRSLDLADLAGDPLILFPRPIGPDLYDSIISACRAAGFNPVISMESPQISSTVNMAAAGFGVTLIPSSMRQIQAKGVTYHALKGGSLHTTIALVHRPRERAPTVQNFVRILRDTARHAQPE